MADSTKKLLAASLRTLMHKRPLSRITVGDICELSEMNRKSLSEMAIQDSAAFAALVAQAKAALK